MQYKEAVKQNPDAPASYMMTIALEVDDASDFKDETLAMRSVIIDWHKQRAKLCERIKLLLIAPPELHTKLLEFVIFVASNDDDFSNALRALEVDIHLYSKDHQEHGVKSVKGADFLSGQF